MRRLLTSRFIGDRLGRRAADLISLGWVLDMAERAPVVARVNGGGRRGQSGGAEAAVVVLCLELGRWGGELAGLLLLLLLQLGRGRAAAPRRFSLSLLTFSTRFRGTDGRMRGQGVS